ncbi:hypothetical protein AB1A64_02590 [Ruegeria sp. ANG10]|uniref:hypothetical protein n=1 Tax=Ruegeria sp. ANG10 TaxID=3042467 RepID=UPI0034532ED5
MSERLVAGQNRWNFGVLLTQSVTREIGYELSSEKLVLPFIYASLGGPLLFAGLLLSTVEFCKFLSQISGAPLVALVSRTKWIVALTTTASAAALFVISLLILDVSSGALVVIFLLTAAVIGLSKGINNLAFQDLLGRSLIKSSRARLLFFSGSVTGFLVIFLVLGSMLFFEVETPREAQTELILIGIGMLLIASLAIAFLREPAKSRQAYAAMDDQSNPLRNYFDELRIGLQTVSKLSWFRKYLKARVLLVTIEVAMPFFAVHASTLHPHTAPSLAVFVIAGSFGMIVGGVVWPRISKNSNRLTMTLSGLFACLAAIGALTLQFYAPLRMPLTHSGVFFLLAVATQGVIVSRTVYIVNATSDAERPYCITLANLAGGAFGLVLAVIVGSITQLQGAVAALVVMVPLNLAGAFYAMKLPAFGSTRTCSER